MATCDLVMKKMVFKISVYTKISDLDTDITCEPQPNFPYQDLLQIFRPLIIIDTMPLHKIRKQILRISMKILNLFKLLRTLTTSSIYYCIKNGLCYLCPTAPDPTPQDLKHYHRHTVLC
jgi:hypothetical protein